jgi:hypothetical protein
MHTIGRNPVQKRRSLHQESRDFVPEIGTMYGRRRRTAEDVIDVVAVDAEEGMTVDVRDTM